MQSTTSSRGAPSRESSRFVLSGIPCNSYCVARFANDGVNALRDRNHVLGLPPEQLHGKEPLWLAEANKLTVRGLGLVAAVFSAGGEAAANFGRYSPGHNPHPHYNYLGRDSSSPRRFLLGMITTIPPGNNHSSSPRRFTTSEP